MRKRKRRRKKTEEEGEEEEEEEEEKFDATVTTIDKIVEKKMFAKNEILNLRKKAKLQIN